MPQFQQSFRLRIDQINQEGRGFRVVINQVDASQGVHLKTAGNTMRAAFIGFRPDGAFEISSKLHCAIESFTLWSAGDLVGPAIVEGENDCEFVDEKALNFTQGSQSLVSVRAALDSRSGITAATGAIQVWGGGGRSPVGTNSFVRETGIFEVIGNVGRSILTISNVRVSEGSVGHEFNGDAIFEVLSTDWNPNGGFKLRLGQWYRRNFYEGARRPYMRDLDFTVTITYVAG